MSEPHHVLLVANRTATMAGLRRAVVQRAMPGWTRFHLVVPATPYGLHRVVDPEVAGREEAKEQLDAALASLSEAAGCNVTGEVGDADPLAAIQDALSPDRFEEIVISTLPRRISRWLRLDLTSSHAGATDGVPLVHLELAESAASHAVRRRPCRRRRLGGGSAAQLPGSRPPHGRGRAGTART